METDKPGIRILKILLKDIAELLAPTIERSIHNNLPEGGTPLEAIKALIRAKGSANTVC